MVNAKKLPRHIAIIMDGNGRWAKKRRLPKIAGHRKGVDAIRRVLDSCLENGIEVLTLYAFSTENWSRPKREVGALMSLIGETISRVVNDLKAEGVRIRFIGRLEELPAGTRKSLESAREATKGNKRLTLNIALNYGGRSEIVDAVNRAIAGGVKDVDEESFGKLLYTEDLPDPDLLIRTSGEERISNFLLWQAAYSELYFTKKLWPDFTKSDMDKALEEYRRRERRYGA